MNRFLDPIRQVLRRWSRHRPDRYHPWIRLAKHYQIEPIPEAEFWFPDLEAWVGDHGYRVGSISPTPQQWLRLGIGKQGLILEEGWNLLPSSWPRLCIGWEQVRRAVVATEARWPQEVGLNLWVEAESMEAGAREFFDELRIWITPGSPGFEALVKALESYVPVDQEVP